MSPIECVEVNSDQLLTTAQDELNQRVVMIDRAASLLSAVKRVQSLRQFWEQTNPGGCFSENWHKQTKSLEQCAHRLQRIIKGVALPIEDSER